MSNEIGNVVARRKKQILLKEILKHKGLYMIILPVIIYYLVFMYKPMYGVIVAFKDFNYRLGIIGSPWAGLKYFEEMFKLTDFWRALQNTLYIAMGRIVYEFPLPIALALVINEIRHTKAKKFFQVVYTFPHFLSWVIVSGIAINMFGDSGVVNSFLQMIGADKVNVLADASNFRYFIFGSSIWKEMGWGTIIFLAAIAGINPNLYEAAKVDGANRWHCIKYITIPSIMPTIMILLILKIGQVMNLGGFDQILNTYNPGVYEVADILDTFIYRRTFVQGASFSSSAAVGIFKSVINCILLVLANFSSKRMGQEGIM